MGKTVLQNTCYKMNVLLYIIPKLMGTYDTSIKLIDIAVTQGNSRAPNPLEETQRNDINQKCFRNFVTHNEANIIMVRVIESFRRAEFTTFCLSLKSPSSPLVRWKNRWFFFGAQRKERRARRECKSSCTLGEASARDRSTVLPEFRYPRRRCGMEQSRTILRALKIP